VKAVKSPIASLQFIRLTSPMIRKFVVSDPAVQDGAPVFQGTTVPVETLIEYRKGDVPVYEFLVDHPTVQPEHAKKAARWLAATESDEVKARLEQLQRAETSTPAASPKK
jgi:uncharacterized protein (DUF433 family)